MKLAIFRNFTKFPFDGHWDGKKRTFAPGEEKVMEEWRARHYAKHLTNRELHRKGPAFENYTSPKKQEDVPEFMAIFNQCFVKLEGDTDEGEIVTDIEQANLDAKRKERAEEVEEKKTRGRGKSKKADKVEKEDVQIADLPEDDSEDNFEGNK